MAYQTLKQKDKDGQIKKETTFTKKIMAKSIIHPGPKKVKSVSAEVPVNSIFQNV
jgi:hypothetical protein